MEITWYGHSCFRITQRNMATVVTDPFDHNEIGYSELKLKADIVTISHPAPGHSFTEAVKGAKWELNGPGEYEIGGVFISAVRTGNGKKNDNRNLVFVCDYDGVTVGHLGDIQDVPKRKEVDAFGTVDVLLVPVGGSSLSAAKAAEVVSLIEPGIVVPMHYSTADTKLKLNDLSVFLKQMGLSNEPESLEALKLTERDIPDDTKVVVLQYQR